MDTWHNTKQNTVQSINIYADGWMKVAHSYNNNFYYLTFGHVIILIVFIMKKFVQFLFLVNGMNFWFMILEFFLFHTEFQIKVKILSIQYPFHSHENVFFSFFYVRLFFLWQFFVLLFVEIQFNSFDIDDNDAIPSFQ